MPDEALPKTKYTLEEVLAAIETGTTLIGTAAVLKCSRQTVQNYAHRWKKVRDALDAKREELVDLAEHRFRKAIMDDQAWAIAFCLKTLGKNRGYVERQEVTGEGGGPVTIKVVYDDR